MIPRGAPIAVIAPCGAYDPDRFAHGLRIAADRGHDLRPLPGLLQPHRYLAAPDDVRLAHIVEALSDPAYAAVWVARGGYGLTRILDRLDPADLARKPIIGFSDVTALFAKLYAHGLGPCVHGPVVHSLPITDAASLDALFALLDGERTDLAGEMWVEGAVEAPVVGGNLCLLAATAGTPDQLDASGHILVLEEIGEPGYRMDRLLQQCRSAGVFDGVVGVVLGELVSCRAPEGADWTVEDMVREHLEALGVPVLAGVPVGHGARNHPFVWGDRAALRDGRLTWT
ncbi:MAG: LD-carboxypeptidase [Myxococcales bacterium]|nr:LD-carboxypeptidase [Myxococcales bacterium]